MNVIERPFNIHDEIIETGLGKLNNQVSAIRQLANLSNSVDYLPVINQLLADSQKTISSLIQDLDKNIKQQREQELSSLKGVCSIDKTSIASLGSGATCSCTNTP